MTSGNPEPVTAKLKAALKRIAEVNRLCGAPSTSVGVLHNGRVLLSDSVGRRDGNPNHPADESSIYLIGSLSKAFVAAAVGILVDEGKMSWFDKISKHLKDFNPVEDRQIAQEADFIDLLRHSSGLGNPVVQVIGPFGAIVGPEDMFMDLVNATQTKDDDGHQRFGRAFEYSNINYGIVALAVEQISKLRFADFIQDRILNPLGMKQTLVTKGAVECSPSLADGHVQLENGTWKRLPVEWTSETNTSVLSAYGIRSSIHDMLIWAAAWLSAPMEGQTSSPKMQAMRDVEYNPLRQAARIFKPAWQLSIDQPNKTPSTYCLGWLRTTMPTSNLNWGSLNKRTMNDGTSLDYTLGADSPARVALKHTGIAYNTTSTIFLFPETNSAVIAMANGRRRGDASDFAAQILIQELFDLRPRVDIMARARTETERGMSYRHNTVMAEWLKNRDITGAERPPGEYLGLYKHPGTYLRIDLDRSVKRLVLHINRRWDKPIYLEYFSKDKYSFFPTTTDEHFSKGFFDFDNYVVGLLDFTRDESQAVNGLYWAWEAESKPIWYKREHQTRIRSVWPKLNKPTSPPAQQKVATRPNNIMETAIIVKKPQSGKLFSEVVKSPATILKKTRTRTGTV